MAHAGTRIRPEPADYDPTQEWLLVGQGEVQTDKWPFAVGVTKTSRWMLCIRGDYAFIRWSFAPAEDAAADWHHTEIAVADMAHAAHRRYLSGIAA